MEYFDFVKAVKYEGPASKNPYAFKFYNADEVILGKKMSEHLPFAMAWWHNLGANGVDETAQFLERGLDRPFRSWPVNAYDNCLFAEVVNFIHTKMIP